MVSGERNLDGRMFSIESVGGGGGELLAILCTDGSMYDTAVICVVEIFGRPHRIGQGLREQSQIMKAFFH